MSTSGKQVMDSHFCCIQKIEVNFVKIRIYSIFRSMTLQNPIRKERMDGEVGFGQRGMEETSSKNYDFLAVIFSFPV